MKTINYDNMARKLVDSVPEMEDLYQHEIDYFEDISNYTFFAAILAKFIFARIDDLSEANKDVLNRVFEFIEKCVDSSDEAVLDVILAGFFQQLDPNASNCKIVVEFMYPKTKLLFSSYNLSFKGADKETLSLIYKLCDIAGDYRGAMSQNNEISSQKYARDYHNCIEKLYAHGWNPSRYGSARFGLKCCLPKRLMPQQFLEDNKMYQQHLQYLFDTDKLAEVFYFREFQIIPFVSPIDKLMSKVKQWFS